MIVTKASPSTASLLPASLLSARLLDAALRVPCSVFSRRISNFLSSRVGRRVTILASLKFYPRI